MLPVVALLLALATLGAGGKAGGDLLTGVLLEATEGVVEAADRTDVLDAVLLVTGLNEFLSTGDEGGLLIAPLVLAAVEGCRGLGVLGDVPVVRTLVVETVEAVESLLARTVPAFKWAPPEAEVELGGISDFAVSNAVEPSLAADSVELGLEMDEGGLDIEEAGLEDGTAEEGGRKVEGPGTPGVDLRNVEVVVLVDLTDAAEDFGLVCSG